MSDSNICTLPASLGRLPQLGQLWIRHCSRLQVLPELPSSLFFLFATGCTSMERLSNVSNCQNCILSLDDCHMLSEIRGFENMKSVAGIYMKGCNNLPNNLKRSLVQGFCHGHGRFEMTLPGGEVPDWLRHKSMGSSIFFKVPPLFDWKIQGFILCAVLTVNKVPKENDLPHIFTVTFHNKTKGHVSKLTSNFCFRMYSFRDYLWVHYIPRTKLESELEHGDQIEVSVQPVHPWEVDLMPGDFVEVKECGVNVVYEEEEEEEEEEEGEGEEDENCWGSESEAIIGSCSEEDENCWGLERYMEDENCWGSESEGIIESCRSQLYAAADFIHTDNSGVRGGGLQTLRLTLNHQQQEEEEDVRQHWFHNICIISAIMSCFGHFKSRRTTD